MFRSRAWCNMNIYFAKAISRSMILPCDGSTLCSIIASVRFQSACNLYIVASTCWSTNFFFIFLLDTFIWHHLPRQKMDVLTILFVLLAISLTLPHRHILNPLQLGDHGQCVSFLSLKVSLTVKYTWQLLRLQYLDLSLK